MISFYIAAMKQITIATVLHPDKSSRVTRLKKYAVFLGSDHGFKYFNSRAAAKKYCVKLSRDLTGVLFALNEQLAGCYVVYRHLWFYTDNNTQGIEYRHAIEQSLAAAAKYMDRSTIWQGENRNSYIVRDLVNASSEIMNIWEALKKISEKRSDWALSAKIKLQIEQCLAVAEKINALLSAL